MAQLEAIRHEIHAGMSIMNPGPMTREILNSASMKPGTSIAILFMARVNSALSDVSWLAYSHPSFFVFLQCLAAAQVASALHSNPATGQTTVLAWQGTVAPNPTHKAGEVPPSGEV